MYTLLVLSWTSILPRKYSSEVLVHDSMKQISQLHIHDVNLPFPKGALLH